MKIWKGHGSEHSMNLVMIGQFKEKKDASEAGDAIHQLIEHVIQSDRDGYISWEEPATRYSDEMLELLSNLRINSISPSDVQQFAYDVHVEVKEDKVVISTDEIDVQAFLKVLISRGARVEVFSAHDYPRELD